MLAESISKSELKSMLRALVSGRYHLLLGAGASHGSRDSKGNPMPLARGLADEISLRFSIPGDESSLVESYERAVRKNGSRKVYEYLRSRFYRCDPDGWLEQLVKVPWQRVWTLNIDDTYERAHRRARSIGRQLDTVSWDDTYSGEALRLQVVHLHGHVVDESPRTLVFSILEYLNATEAAHAWHRVFGDSFVSSPYVIIGANLRDEYDLARVLRERRPQATAPSIYVAPSISEGMQDDLRSWGFIPIQASGREFVEELMSLAQPIIDEGVSAWGLAGQSAELLRFSQQFKMLETRATLPQGRDHDFYLGDVPSWSDIVNNRDSIFGWTEVALRRATEILEESPEHAQLLVALGAKFSGRTTGLFRIAREMNDRHIRTFIYRGEGRVDIDAVHSYLRDSGEAVLIFDGLADFADDIDDLLHRCNKGGNNLLVIAAENSRRTPLLLARLSSNNFRRDNVVEISHNFGRRDARTLVAKLGPIGRLGKLTPMPHQRQISHFTRNGLFVGMAELEGGIGFKARMRKEIDHLHDKWMIRVVLLASLVETLNYAVPVQLAATAVGESAERIFSAIEQDNAMAALIEIDGELCLHPRMRHLLVDELILRIGRSETADLLGNFVKRARPYINERTQFSRSLTARIVVGLLRAKALAKWIGTEDLDNWYEDVRPQYGWNGRYWEQRAIAASLVNNFSLAESFAEKSVSLAPDSYRYTNLGTILLKKAAMAASISEDESERVYLRARQSLDKAYGLDGKNIVPLLSFLEGSLKVLVGGISRQGVLYETIVRDWSDRYADARLRQGAEISTDIRENLDFLRRRWDALED